VVSPIQQSSRLGFQPRHCITITFDPLPLPSDVLGCMPLQFTDINWRVRPADCDNVTRLWLRVRVLGRFDGGENNAWSVGAAVAVAQAGSRARLASAGNPASTCTPVNNTAAAASSRWLGRRTWKRGRRLVARTETMAILHDMRGQSDQRLVAGRPAGRRTGGEMVNQE
jgi:hypothetical protein